MLVDYVKIDCWAADLNYGKLEKACKSQAMMGKELADFKDFLSCSPKFSQAVRHVISPAMPGSHVVSGLHILGDSRVSVGEGVLL